MAHNGIILLSHDVFILLYQPSSKQEVNKEMIRNCTSEDFYDVALLMKQLFPDKEACLDNLKYAFEKMLNSKDYILLCVEINKVVVGFCSLAILYDFWAEGKICYLTYLIVDAKYRGRGIGKALLKEVEYISIKNRCKKIDLESSFHREASHKFYIENGYEKWAYFFTKQL